nr:MAG TPA: hypothetical protein [Caudoviricetes sp.]
MEKIVFNSRCGRLARELVCFQISLAILELKAQKVKSL